MPTLMPMIPKTTRRARDIMRGSRRGADAVVYALDMAVGGRVDGGDDGDGDGDGREGGGGGVEEEGKGGGRGRNGLYRACAALNRRKQAAFGNARITSTGDCLCSAIGVDPGDVTKGEYRRVTARLS